MPTFTVGTSQTHATITLGIDAVQGDLAGGLIQDVQVFATAGTYDEQVDALAGFTNASASDFIRIEAQVNHRGLRDQGIVNQFSGTGSAVKIFQLGDFTEVIGFNVSTDGQNVSGLQGITTNASGLVDRCMVYNLRGGNDASHWGIRIGGGATIRNCVVMDMVLSTGGICEAFETFSGSANIDFENCVAFNISINATTISAFRRVGAGANVTATNCYGEATPGSGRTNFRGFATGTVNNCISADSSSDDFGGSGNLINKSPSDQFVNVTSGSEDPHLKSGADCIDAGQDLSSTVIVDIDNGIRPDHGDDPFDVGADDFSVGPPDDGIPISVVQISGGTRFSDLPSSFESSRYLRR